MLEKIPSGVGHALRGVRAGFEKLVSEGEGSAHVSGRLQLRSEAFEDGGSIPPRYTADGEKLSPPLSWTEVPAAAASLVLIVEDPDAPTPEPLLHLLAWDLAPDLDGVAEGMFKGPDHNGLDENLGRNAYLQAAYLPPDPPSGHGAHLYAFQLFALDRRLDFDRPPSRKAVVEAMKGHIIAKGVLLGAYERA